MTLTLLGLTAAPCGAGAQVWQFATTGSLIEFRYDHTATQLPDGRVLITGGGYSGGSTRASAELYDPATGTFSAAGTLRTARGGHTATLLANGKVLIVGGTHPYAPGNIVEVYDPATTTFTGIAGLSPTRSHHTATLLPNGKVLIAGGYYFDGSVFASMTSAVLFDPVTGTFTATGSLGERRMRHTATLLPNGKVLIAGGIHSTNGQSGAWTTAGAEIYDPVAGTFTPTGGMNAARNTHTATLLPNGSVLVAGGDTRDGANGVDLASAESYDPEAGTFTATGSMVAGRSGHTATLLPTGKVLIAGGAASDSWGYPSRSAETYDAATGTFSATGSMITSRSRFTATLLSVNGKVLVAGGYSAPDTGTAGAELFGNAQCQ